jgi:lipoate synthase
LATATLERRIPLRLETQYPRPSPLHPVARWAPPEEVVELAEKDRQIGFLGVLSGPLVRSSCQAGQLYADEKARLAAGALINTKRITRP